MIYEVKSHYVISSGGAWLPGVYDTQKTARWAFQFPNAVLEKAQEIANERDGVITADDLRALKEQG